MWKNIENISDNYKCAWLLGGNFNDVMKANEKFEGNLINRRKVSNLWVSINYCNLMDMGFKGCTYTWSNHKNYRDGLIMERLDKTFAN